MGVRLANSADDLCQSGLRAHLRSFGGLLLADYSEWRDSIYPDDLNYAERSLNEVIEKGSIEDREYRIIRADGEVRWLSDKCFVSQRADVSQRLIVVGIAEDITEKKHLEDELQRLATTDVLTQSSNRRHFFRMRPARVRTGSSQRHAAGVPAAGHR